MITDLLMCVSRQSGATPLHCAVSRAIEAVAAALIASKAAVNAVDKVRRGSRVRGISPFSIFFSTRAQTDRQTQADRQMATDRKKNGHCGHQVGGAGGARGRHRCPYSLLELPH